MRYYADILGDVISRMDYSICVESVESLGSNQWKLHVCDCSTTLHARPSSVNRQITISNSGHDYKVTGVENDQWVEIYSTTTPATGKYTLPIPTYRHGSPMEITEQIKSEMTDPNRYPMVWLLEVMNIDVTGKYDYNSNYEMEPDVRFYVLDFASFAKQNGPIYDNTVRPMGNLGDRIIEQLIKLEVGDIPTRVSQIPYAKFGSNYTNANTADRNSALLSWLPDQVGGVEIRLKQPIYKQ